MCGAVAYAEVGFHFHDSSGGAAMNQDFSQTIARDINGGAGVKIARKDG
jgi:hypothetical protein